MRRARGSPSPTAVARALRRRYGSPRLARAQPLDALLELLCSTKTTGHGCKTAYRALRRKFPSFHALARARIDSLAAPLRPAGLPRQRACNLRAVCRIVARRFGRFSLAPLRRVDDAACEQFLLSLPGVGRKVARCTMLFALQRPVFPVDTHCWRIALRLGWMPSRRAQALMTDADADRLQALIPPRARLALHLHLIRLGREYCRARQTFCASCPLAEICPSAQTLTATALPAAPQSPDRAGNASPRQR